MRHRRVICSLAVLLTLGCVLVMGSLYWYRTMPIQDLVNVWTLSMISVTDENALNHCDELEINDTVEIISLLSRCKVKRAKVKKFPDVMYRAYLVGTPVSNKQEIVNFVFGSNEDRCFVEYTTSGRDYTVYQLVIELEDYMYIRALLDKILQVRQSCKSGFATEKLGIWPDSVRMLLTRARKNAHYPL